MKTKTFVIVLFAVLAFGCDNSQDEKIARLEKENAALLKIAGPPPAVLDSLYPPVAPAPLYRIRMQELAGPFAGFVLKVMEEDRGAARGMFNAFREQYVLISELVPEWKWDYPVEPLDELDALIEGGEVGAIMEAFQKVGDICHQCHLTQMPKVQQKYHWDEFSLISLTDPVSNTVLEFRQFMMSMELSVGGMMGEIQAGNADGVVGHLENFRKYLDNLKEGCTACHNSERKYYVDENVLSYVDNLEEAVRAEVPDMNAAFQFAQLIGDEMCFKCHLVHVPAAYARPVWKEVEDLHP